MQDLVDRLVTAGINFGMKVNIGKTKVIHISKSQINIQRRKIIRTGEIIQVFRKHNICRWKVQQRNKNKDSNGKDGI